MKNCVNRLVNTSLAGGDPGREDIEVVKVPAGDIAEDMGNIKVANMVMLGAYSAYSDFVTLADIESAVTEFLPPRHRDLLQLNLEALNKGHESIRGKR